MNTKAIILPDKKYSIWQRLLFRYYDSWFYEEVYRYSWLYRLRWHITHWYRKDHWIKTNLSIGYHDKPVLMEDALFSLVEDFIAKDGEDAPTQIVIENEQFEIIRDILHFYRIRKPEMEKEYDYYLHEVYKDTHMNFTPCEDRPKYSVLKFEYTGQYTEEELDDMRKKMYDLEEKIYAETQEMLKKIIDIRMYIWT